MLKFFFLINFFVFSPIVLLADNDDLFVDSLMQTMSLSEKIGQMTLIDFPALNGIMNDLSDYSIGAVLSGGDSNPDPNIPQEWADQSDTVQYYASLSRSKIPVLYGIDAVHGHNNVFRATVFPHNIGLGATRDTTLCRKIAQVTARDMLATGIYWSFSPCLAVPQDDRWGRVYEGFSENPLVVSDLGASMVEGLQGVEGDSCRVLACMKHWVADGATKYGVDRGNAEIDSATLFNTHIFPYRKSIDVHAGSVMASFSLINNEPNHSNRSLLVDELRHNLGFTGFVVSDWSAIDLLPGDYYSDVVTSVNAGVDMIMVPIEYKKFIRTLTLAVENNDVSMVRVDEACRRILSAKKQLGLFEYSKAHRNLLSSVGDASSRRLAREAVAKSVVILENTDNILPLSILPDTVYVLGLHADDIGLQCGGWTIGWQGARGQITIGQSLLSALQEEFPHVVFERSVFGENLPKNSLCIATVGEYPYAEWFGDNESLLFGAKMIAPIQNAFNSGAKIITVLMTGRVMMLDAVKPLSDVLIAAWLPGSEAGGIVDILTGVRPAVGKLGYTWPKNIGAIPLNSSNAHSDGVLYPYGYGLSLTDKAPQRIEALAIEGGKAVVIKGGVDSIMSVSVRGVRCSIDSFKRDPNCTILYHSQIIYPGEKATLFCVADRRELTVPIDNFQSASIAVPSKFSLNKFSWQKSIALDEIWDAQGAEAVILKSGSVLYYNLNVDVSGNYTVNLRGDSRNAKLRITLGGDAFLVDLAESGWRSAIVDLYISSGETVMTIECLSGEWTGNWVSFDVFVKRNRL